MKTYRITHLDGRVEDIPTSRASGFSRLTSETLTIGERMNYGPDKILKTFVLSSIVAWEVIES